MTINDLLTLIKQATPHADLALIEKAYDFAALAHQGQRRLSGESFIVHPLAVGRILAELQLDPITIAAGILHDVVEDTNCTSTELEQAFGPEISGLVDGVTKLSRLEFRSKEEQQVENLRKMFIAMARDIRVLLIKLADRLHNMQTLSHQSPEKQKEIARETLEIFAPLAHRLGIFRLKSQLEDSALLYLNSEEYHRLEQAIAMQRRDQEEYIQQVIVQLQQNLEQAGIKVDIQGRPKHYYSIYHKMRSQHKQLEEIYDLIAIRVIVHGMRDCYAALGLIHTLWKPLPGRFKDYIAMPKPNMYQSLHTTVLGPSGHPFEIQIRTWEMHRTAEYGIAAHWRYKEGQPGDQEFEAKLAWLRQLLEWQYELKDAREFMEALRIDLFADSVYVFTPKGDVIELPAGSVPLDFAYRVHTEVGHRCVGAKVNGRIVPLEYLLQTGDIVQVLTNKSSGPSRDWLKLVKTSQAKNRIRAWFKKERREENLARGKELLEREARKVGIDHAQVNKLDRLAEIGRKFSLYSAEELWVAVGLGSISAQQVLTRWREEYGEPVTQTATILPWMGKSPQGVVVKDVGDSVVRFSRCCNPLPGDPIVGYITRGRGVSIHHQDCANLASLSRVEGERLIEMIWHNFEGGVYQVQIEALALDRPRLTSDIMTSIADTKTIVNSVHARATKNNMALVDLKVEIRDLDHLEYVIEHIKRVKDVQEVKRLTPGLINKRQA